VIYIYEISVESYWTCTLAHLGK